jgi:hypothetical protein
VRNEEISEPEIFLEIDQQIEILRLDRAIERRYRFVANHKLGAQDERSCDTDSLPLTAGEFVWITLQGCLGVADLADDLENPAPPRFRIVNAVNLERRIEDGADALARIERSERVLKHHLHGAANGPQRPFPELADVFPVEAITPSQGWIAWDSLK